MKSRYTVLFVFALVASAAWSQATNFIYYESATALDRSVYKHVIEAVQGADPTAEVFHSDDMRILMVRSTSGLPETAYRAPIESAGISLLPGTRTPEQLGLNQVDPNRPPVFVSTGDEAADRARYEAEVARWNQEHPEQPYGTPVHLRNGQ